MVGITRPWIPQYGCAHETRRNHTCKVGPVGLEPTTYGLKVRSSAY